MTKTADDVRTPTTDRRARRRQETIAEILDLAEQIMTEEGVPGLTLAEVARRLGVQPPSLYKYFPSLTAVYDALFEQGHPRRSRAKRADTGTPSKQPSRQRRLGSFDVSRSTRGTRSPTPRRCRVPRT